MLRRKAVCGQIYLIIVLFWVGEFVADAQGQQIVSTLPDLCGSEYRAAPFPLYTVGRFTYQIPINYDIVSARITGTWGNSCYAKSTAGVDIKLEGLLVARCTSGDPGCWVDNPSGRTRSWSYDIPPSLFPQLATGSAVLTAQQTSPIYVEIGSFNLTITISARSCPFSLVPGSRSHGPGAEAGSVLVSGPSNCQWTAASNDPWVTITSPSSGVGGNTLTYSVAANPSSSARSTFIAAAGQTFTITQAGAPTATIGVGTSPSGLSFTVDGTTYTASQRFTWVVGSSHTIATTTPQGSGGTRYVFANWSDGGAIGHTVTVPAGGATYTANFTTQYQLTTAVSPAASGTIGANPGSSDGYYNSGTSVQLSATANAGYAFANWSGGLTGPTSPQSIVMSAARSVTANFYVIVTITSTPAGRDIAVDGFMFSGPQTFFWVVGSSHTIGTTAIQAVAGARYTFTSWSDGGGSTHTITAPASATTYTANYTTAYLLTTAVSPVSGGSVAAIPSSADWYYNSGTSVQLAATANAGYSFANWSGDLTGPANAQSVTMSAPRNVTANFSSISGATITTNPAGLSFTVDGATYTGAQTFTWITGSSHTIATTSPQGSGGTRYVFADWSDGGAISHTVTARAVATTYTANFTTQYQLTTAAAPVSGGSVSANPNSADGYYSSGASVQLTAAANTGYVFSSWSGDLTGSTNPQPVTMSAPRGVTANFAATSGVTVTTNPAGLNLTVDGATYGGAQTFTWITGSSHTIATTSPQGSGGTRYVFANWSDGGAISHAITAPAGAATYTANFATQYQLTTAAAPASGGSVSANPSSADGYYSSGASVQLTAAANTGYVFSSWSGDLTGSANPQSVTMSAPRGVTANFAATSGVTVTTNPAGLGFTVDGATYTGAQTFSWVTGSSHTIATTSPQGSGGTRYVFANWSDGGAISHVITAPAGAATYTANFAAQYQLTTAAAPANGGSVSANPSSADGYYGSGASVQLSAISNGGYVFSNWSGDLAGSTNPQSVTMSAPRGVTANFSSLSGATITTSPAGLGFTVDGATYTGAQTFSWVTGSSHTIATASPQGSGGTRYVFANWSDGGAISHTIAAPSGGATYTANFTTQYRLTTGPSPAAGGSVSANPSSEEGYYSAGASVQLLATANAGYVFGGWSGDLSGMTNPQTVTMSVPRSVVAYFNASTQGIAISSLSPSRAAAGGPGFMLTVNGTGFAAGVSAVYWNGVIQNTTFINSVQLTARIDPVVIAFPGTAKIIVVSGGTSSNTLPFTIDRPLSPTPVISIISPGSAVVGGPAFDLQVYGSSFLPDSTVRWNGADRPTTFLSSKQLRAGILVSDIASAGANTVTVSNSGGVISNPVSFAISSPSPILTAVSPPSVAAGSADFTLTVYGLNFTRGAAIQWNGLSRQTSFVSNSTLTAAISAGDVSTAGTAVITVINGDGSKSNPRSLQTVAVAAGAPSITGVSPDPIQVGGPSFTLTVQGSGFSSSSKVQWNGQNRETKFITVNELQAGILAADIATPGVFTVTVTNPASSAAAPEFEAEDSVGSTPLGLSTVTTPLPFITRLNPTSAVAGSSGFNLVIEGLGFVKDTSYVQWGNKKILANFISSTQISVDMPGVDFAAEGAINFVVSNPPPGGGASDSRTFTITSKKPTVTQLYYPRLASSAGGPKGSENTGIAIANLSGKDATLTIHAFNKQGIEIAGPKITNPVSLSISSIEQRAATDSQVFGPGMSEQNAVGWMKLESSESKVAGFFLVFDDNLSTLDGADVSSTTLSSFIFPEIEDQGFNQYHVANPNSASVKLTFELYKSDGTLRASPVVRNINANGAVAEFFTDLFPGVAAVASDYIWVTADRGVVSFSYLGRQGHDAEGLNGQDATKGTSTLYSPQYVVGGPDWRTTLSVVNLDSSAANVTLRFIGDDGAQIGVTKVVRIPGRGKVFIPDQTLFLDAGSKMTQGYLEIKSDGAGLTGSVVFGDPERSRFTSALPLVSTLQSSVVFGQVASGQVGDKEYYTGVALLNPSDVEANAKIELFDRDGRQVASKTEVVPARRRKSQLLTQYFEGLTGQNIGSGYIKVTADRGLASFALFGTKDTLSAVPAQIVP